MAAAASGKDGGRGAGLERDAIVREALKLLDEVGFAGLTQRRLADRLKVKAAALYWHFESKQDLIDAIAEHIMVDEYTAHQKSISPDVGWRTLLAQVAYTNRAALMRYRDGAQLMAHARMGNNNMMEGMELLLKSLAAQGFTPRQSMTAFFTIVRYTLGFAFEEQADPRSPQEMQERRQQMLQMADRFPHIARAFADAQQAGAKKSDVLFERGLQLILDGVEQSLHKNKTSA